MPVLGEDDMGEAACELVDNRDYLVPAFYSQGAAGAEVILNVHHEQCSVLGRRLPFPA